MQLRDSQKAIGIDGDRITYVMPLQEAPHDADTITLNDSILMPGFVNAHCHLDLSHLRGKIEFSGSFAEWIQKVVQLRETLQEDDVARASNELLKSGVTTLYDHVGAFSELSYLIDTPFRKQFFMEVIGVTEEMANDMLQKQCERAIIAQRDGVPATASPHATHSLNPTVFRKALSVQGFFSIHCAESSEEWDMFSKGSGKLWDFIATRGPTPTRCHDSPLQYLADNQLLPQNWLAIHCNTLTDSDIALLKKTHATVVHCPRSHRYFKHPPFPLERLRSAEVPVRIGTDSLASCDNFDFLEELRAMRDEFPFLKDEEILQMASGKLAAGSFADIIGLPMQDDILQGPVTFSMIGGQRVI